MTDLKVRRTTVTEQSETGATVEVWISDHEDPAAAKEEISILVRVEHEKIPPLAEVQAKALERAQTVIKREIQAKRFPANP